MATTEEIQQRNYERINQLLGEVEELQKQVHDILYHKHWWVRWLGLGRATKLHKLANKKLDSIADGTALRN